MREPARRTRISRAVRSETITSWCGAMWSLCAWETNAKRFPSHDPFEIFREVFGGGGFGGGIFRQGLQCDRPLSEVQFHLVFFSQCPRLDAACAKIGGKSCGETMER